jgi:hypothetical protein
MDYPNGAPNTPADGHGAKISALAARRLLALAGMGLVFRYWRRHWPPLVLCRCRPPVVIFLGHELSGLYVPVNIAKRWLLSHPELNLVSPNMPGADNSRPS